MTGKFGFWVLCALACLAAGTTRAQNVVTASPAIPATPAAVDTPIYVSPYEIIVTAQRLNLQLKENPAAVSVLGQKTLHEMPRAAATDEALKLVPGLHVENVTDGERVHMSIRGQGILTERGIRGIQVLLDGLPLNDPTGVAPDLYDVDWATIDHVEVQRGPAAALYGGGASAGVVSISTKEGENKPLGATLSTTLGSNRFVKSLAEIDGSVKDVNYLFSASPMSGHGFAEHTDFRAGNIYCKVHWHPSSRLSFTPILAYTSYFDQNPEGLNLEQLSTDPHQANPDALTYNEYYQTHRFTAGLVGRFLMDQWQDVQFSGYFRRTLYQESVPSSVLHRQIQSPGASLQYNRHWGGGWLKNWTSLGVDINWQTIDEHRQENLGDAVEGGLLSQQRIAQGSTGLFLLDRLALGPDWGIMAGIGSNAIRNKLTDLMLSDTVNLSGSENFSKTTARAGVTFNPSRYANLYANWGQGFLPPATEELANNPEHLGGLNRELVPSTSQSEEVGVRGGLRDNLHYDLAFFLLQTDNDFDRYRITSRPLETFYRNAGRSHRYGLETYLDWAPVNSLAIQGAYTFSHFKYTNPSPYDGHWLPDTPQHILTMSADYRVWRCLSIGVSSEIRTNWYVDPMDTVTAPGFTLWGARAEFDWNWSNLHGEITLVVRNLLDRDFISYTEPDPDGNSYQHGPGREIIGGLLLRL